jgi:hypothetical protein
MALAAVDPIEEAVNALPPFMQRRMAKLSLAGARFTMEAHAIYAWKVYGPQGQLYRYTHLAQAINEVWREWLMGMDAREATTEAAYDQFDSREWTGL